MTNEEWLEIDAACREMKRRVGRREKFRAVKDLLAIVLTLGGIMVGFATGLGWILIVPATLTCFALYLDRT